MKIYYTIILLLFSTFSFGNDYLSIKSSLKTAKHLENIGDIDGAIAIFYSILDEKPHHSLSIERLKTLFMNYQRYDEGINFFQKQLSRSPNNLKLYPDLGEFYFLNNNKIEAKTIWSNGLNKFKNSRSIYRIMLSKYTRLGLDKEIHELLKIGRKKFEESFLSYETGVYYQAKKAYDMAMDQYILYLIYEPKQVNIIERRIILMSDDEESIPIIEKKLSIASEKNPKKILNVLSQFYFKKQDYKKSYEIKVKWSNLDKINHEKWLEFGNELRKENQYKYSIDAYNFILKNNRNNNVSGRALLGLANTFEDQIIPDHDQHIIPYFFDNNIFFEDPFQVYSSISQNHLTSSIELYDSILVTLKKSPLVSEAYFKLGEIQYRILQDFDQAYYLFNKALANHPEEQLRVETILRISDVLIAKSQLNQALEFLKKQNKRNPLTEIEMKEILVHFLNGDSDTTLNKVNELIMKINPIDPFFNDLIELKNIFTKYQPKEKNDTIALSHFIKAELYLRQKKIGDAIKELIFITDNYNNTKIVPLVNLRLGLLHYRINDYENSLKFVSFIEDTDLSDKGKIFKGQIYEKKFFDYEKAIEFYMEILDKNPKSIYSEPVRYHIRTLQKTES